jgi:hypothetical protein
MITSMRRPRVADNGNAEAGVLRLQDGGAARGACLQAATGVVASGPDETPESPGRGAADAAARLQARMTTAAGKAIGAGVATSRRN